jgi:hypothetical protein
MTLSLFSNCRLPMVVTKEMDPRRILEVFFLLCFWCGHGMIDVSAAALVSEVSLSRIILYDWPSLASRQQGLDNKNNRTGQPAGAEARSSSTGYPQTKDSGSQESCVPFCQGSQRLWCLRTGTILWCREALGNSLLNKGVYLGRMQHSGARNGSTLELDFATRQIQLQEMGFEEGFITQALRAHG